MIDEGYTFSLFGKPHRQGDMDARVLPGTNPPRAVIYHHQDAELERWRRSVAAACSDRMLEVGALRVEKPVAVELSIRWQFVWRKQDLNAAADPKPGAREWKSTTPDIDKLERALLDALTGVAYADDAQVARVVKEKGYGRTFHTTVTVRALS